MKQELAHIGIHDNKEHRKILEEHFNNVINDKSNVSKIEERQYIKKELPEKPVIKYTSVTKESFLWDLVEVYFLKQFGMKTDY